MPIRFFQSTALFFVCLLCVSPFGFSQISNLDNFIEGQLTEQNIPGLAACVIKDGAIVWEGAYGVTDLDTNTPVDRQTLFTIASLSKLVTATAVMQLVEQGAISIDDDVDDYLDFEISNPNFPAEPITFRQLLRHRSSLKDSESLLFDSWVDGDSPIALEDYVRDYVSVEGDNFDATIFNDASGPNQTTWYSNYGFALLGYLVESISGMPFHAYCKTNIFDPLCMEQTTFFFEDMNLEQYAIPHNTSGGNQISLGTYSIANYPAALLKTNIEELSRFLIAYTQRGEMDGVRIFSESSADALTPYDFESANVGWWNGTSWTYSFYFPDEAVWYHGGFMPGVRARMNYYPQDSTGIIILTNGQGQYRYVEDTLQSYIPQFSSSLSDSLPCATISSIETINDDGNTFELHPNPVNDVLHLKTNEANWEYFEIRNTDGKLVRRFESRSTINCQSLNQGIYWLIGIGSDGLSSQRFVKI